MTRGGKTLKPSVLLISQWQRKNLSIALRLITCLQNFYYAVMYLIPIILDILKIGLWVLSLDLAKKEILMA